jgi:mono/diheme cytochrome c family protein
MVRSLVPRVERAHAPTHLGCRERSGTRWALMRWLPAIGVVAIALAAVACVGASNDEQLTGAALVAKGDDLFHGAGTCQTCHGADLRGTAMGPSFLDPIYAPGHHPDAAFYAAVDRGVPPHHWKFGSMPPVPHIDEDDVEAIIAYVRSEQREADIR